MKIMGVKKMYFLLFLLLLGISGFAQQKTITGKVNDESGAGLAGVNVVQKGTTIGTTTDTDGNY